MDEITKNSEIKYKKCSKCGNTLELNETNFRKRKEKSKDGFRGQCKKCMNEIGRKIGKNYRKSNKFKEYHKQYVLKNKNKIREHGIAYEKTYQDRRKELRIRDGEKRRERGRKFYQEHKEQKAEYNKTYSEIHKEKIKERNKKHYLEHKEEVDDKNRQSYRKNIQNRKQHRLKTRYNITLEQREQILKNQNYRCGCCDCDLKLLENRDINIDHCHFTGILRKILCGACNRALGFMKEDLEKIQGLKNYAIYCKITNFTGFPKYTKDSRKKSKIEMLEKQNYKCASCTIDLKNLDIIKIHTDHDHSNKRVRSALCRG